MLHVRYLKECILLFFACTFWTACSSQWREGDLSVDSNQVVSNAREALQLSLQSGSGTSRFQLMFEKSGSRIYYAEGPSQVNNGNESTPVSVEGVAPVYEWGFMGSQYSSLHPRDGGGIKGVRIFLIEEPVSEAASKYSFMVHLFLESGSQVVRTFDHSEQALPQVSEGALQLNLTGSHGGQLVLLTTDLTGDGLLGDVIQFSVYSPDGSNQLQYRGKFATLIGI